ncbi:MAG: hypothetical protein QGG71_23140, partial [Pirellulaceae bacterium]|nr:hypothetical protein [Pirellulaceae bacterium]
LIQPPITQQQDRPSRQSGTRPNRHRHALWHVQGSISQFIGDASVVTGRMAFISCGTLAGIVILEFSLSLL